MAECPFRVITPAALDVLFVRFAPGALKNFRHPGGVLIFDEDSKGEYSFFTSTFTEKYHPPPTRNSEQSKAVDMCNKLLML